MKRYSRAAIYKLKQCENKDGLKFYDAVLVEQCFNANRPYGNWETSFIKCNIMCDIDLEIANFDLHIDRNPLGMKNISNPKHSIIRILDFSVENHTVWEKTTRYSKPYYHQKMTADNKPMLQQKFYILACEYDTPNWKPEESKLAYFEQRNKENIAELTKLRKEYKNAVKQWKTEQTKHSKTREKLKELKDQIKKEKLEKNKIKVETPKELKAFKVVDFEDM